jgi:uracil-DNA glycosylase family protein
MAPRATEMPAARHSKAAKQRRPATKQQELALSRESEAASLTDVREEAMGCKRCDLWKAATQTVFGEGPVSARIVFVGEQPGDQEDIAGRPFVGPAGRLLDQILEEADLDRRITYVTNAVKHFKFEPRGKRRIHSKPNAGEIRACRWWLDKELALIQPDLVVALGATAAQSLLGRSVPVIKMRAEVLEREDGLRVFITIHPSMLLRIPDPADKEAERARFLKDIKKVKELMAA